MDPTGLAMAGIYAQALLEIVPDNADAERVAGELAAIASLADEAEGLRGLLAQGILTEATQSQLVVRIFAGRVSPEVEAFLAVLVRKGRGNLLASIAVVFRKLLNRRQGKVEVAVTTAVELTDDQRQNLSSAIASVLGAEPLLEVRVDKDILGGLVVRVGDDVFDASLAAELKRMKRRLTGPAAA
jgi:F-type H+-transporting ATPase subunit delta